MGKGSEPLPVPNARDMCMLWKSLCRFIHLSARLMTVAEPAPYITMLLVSKFASPYVYHIAVPSLSVYLAFLHSL